MNTYKHRGETIKAKTCIDGIFIDPVLPKDFESTDNAKRPASHQIWFGTPFITCYYETGPNFLAHWPAGIRFDVRCLDGGAWDRSTCHGSFGTLPEAIAKAKTWAPIAEAPAFHIAKE